MDDTAISKYIDDAVTRADITAKERQAIWQKEQDERYALWLQQQDEKHTIWEKESDERMQRYVGAMKEDTTYKMEAIREVVMPLLNLPEQVRRLQETTDEMKYTVDATFEQVGKLSEEHELLKQTVVRHEAILDRK